MEAGGGAWDEREVAADARGAPTREALAELLGSTRLWFVDAGPWQLLVREGWREQGLPPTLEITRDDGTATIGGPVALVARTKSGWASLTDGDVRLVRTLPWASFARA